MMSNERQEEIAAAGAEAVLKLKDGDTIGVVVVQFTAGDDCVVSFNVEGNPKTAALVAARLEHIAQQIEDHINDRWRRIADSN